jgi:hypothetical protein
MAKYGAMDSSIMGQMKALEEKSRRPKRMYAVSCSLIVRRRLPETTAPPARRRVTLCNPMLVTPFFPVLTRRRLVPLKKSPGGEKTSDFAQARRISGSYFQFSRGGLGWR